MIIGLVGRTNVGKSTLFNRLLGTFRAIVTDIAGTTRELLREDCIIKGKKTILADSPGLEEFSEEKVFIQQIIDEADVLLFLVDGKLELGEQDVAIRDMIMQSGKKKNTILLVNKLDGKVYDKNIQVLLADYYSLGFENLIPISSKEQEGLFFVTDALEEKAKTLAIERLPVKKKNNGEDFEEEKEEFHFGRKVKENEVHLAILGRPNVGKSTLLNTFSGEEIAWVKDEPGTTLDYITAEFLYKNKKIHVYDTAGIRKKGKTVGLEKIAYTKTLKMIERVKPIVMIIIDLEEGMTHRDKSLIGELVDLGVAIVIALNKIDLFYPDKVDVFEKKIKHNLGINRLSVKRISGKDGIGLPALLDEILRLQGDYGKRIATPKLNKVLKTARIQSPPRFPKNKICKWKYITQVGENPPTFMLSVNNKDYANFSFIAWIENVIRKKFGFKGVPLRMKFTSKVEKNPYLTKNMG